MTRSTLGIGDKQIDPDVSILLYLILFSFNTNIQISILAIDVF